MSEFPVFAPIKNLEFDRPRMAREMEEVCKLQHHVALRTDENGVTEFSRGVTFEVAPREVRLNTHRMEGDQVVEGHYGSYLVSNLTYLPEHPESRLLQSRILPDGSRQLYLYLYQKPWTWDETLEVPYIRETIAALPFEYVQVVRSVVLLPPAIGPIHVDSGAKAAAKYYQDGFASITFNILQGGARFLFQAKDTVHEVDHSVYAWHFDPSVPHGTTEVDSPRYQLRVFGKLREGTAYLDLLEMDRAVWA